MYFKEGRNVVYVADDLRTNIVGRHAQLCYKNKEHDVLIESWLNPCRLGYFIAVRSEIVYNPHAHHSF